MVAALELHFAYMQTSTHECFGDTSHVHMCLHVMQSHSLIGSWKNQYSSTSSQVITSFAYTGNVMVSVNTMVCVELLRYGGHRGLLLEIHM